jgi:DNA-binding NtrC family response regulator
MEQALLRIRLISNQGVLTMKPRILIVDDDDAITQQLFWTLSDDYDVMTANNMPTAIRRATVYEPDVSIVDLYLPPAIESPEVGLRVLEFIKAHVPGGKVLAVSSANGVETQKACYAAGADEFLNKPFETEMLLASLRRMSPHRAWTSSDLPLSNRY